MSEDFQQPWPRTEEELLAYIREVTEPPSVPEGYAEMTLEERVSNQQMSDGYERTANSMWKAALAAFNYAAHRNGCTGFQGGWASMQFLKHARNIKGPFAILDAEQMLYPQYDLPGKVEGWFEEWHEWLSEEARRLLAERDRDMVASTVWEHWVALAAWTPEEADGE